MFKMPKGTTYKSKGIIIEKMYFDCCAKCKFYEYPKTDYDNPNVFVQQKCNKGLNDKCPSYK